MTEIFLQKTTENHSKHNRSLPERDSRTKFITSDRDQPQQDEMTQFREKVSLTKVLTIVRGKLVSRRGYYEPKET